MVGSLKINTALEYSTRVVQKGDRRCEKSTLNDLAYLTPLRIPLMNPVLDYSRQAFTADVLIQENWKRRRRKRALFLNQMNKILPRIKVRGTVSLKGFWHLSQELNLKTKIMQCNPLSSRHFLLFCSSVGPHDSWHTISLTFLQTKALMKNWRRYCKAWIWRVRLRAKMRQGVSHLPLSYYFSMSYFCMKGTVHTVER